MHLSFLVQKTELNYLHQSPLKYFKHCNIRENIISNKHALLKKRKTKISHIFGTDGDISKIRKVLNLAYHKEQAVEVSQKSVNFSFAGVKGLCNVTLCT